MSILLLSSLPFSSLDYEFDSIRYQKMRKPQMAATEAALRNFEFNLAGSNESCQLEDVKNILIEKGVAESCLSHQKIDIIPLFPKLSKPRGCRVNVMSHNIFHIIETRSTPDSVVEFLLKLIDWLPEYEAIEEQFKQEQEKEKITRKTAFDLLKQVAGKILDEKGYGYQVEEETYFNKASLRINTAKTFTTTIVVDLLDNFHDDLVRQLEAMPDFAGK